MYYKYLSLFVHSQKPNLDLILHTFRHRISLDRTIFIGLNLFYCFIPRKKTRKKQKVQSWSIRSIEVRFAQNLKEWNHKIKNRRVVGRTGRMRVLFGDRGIKNIKSTANILAPKLSCTSCFDRWPAIRSAVGSSTYYHYQLVTRTMYVIIDIIDKTGRNNHNSLFCGLTTYLFIFFNVLLSCHLVRRLYRIQTVHAPVRVILLLLSSSRVRLSASWLVTTAIVRSKQ